MSYSEPRSRPLTVLAADLAAVTPSVVAAAVIDAAHHAPPRWAQPRIVEVAAARPEVEVRRAVLAGLSALARRRALDRDGDLQRLIDIALADARLRGTAEDLLDDIETYGT